MENNPVSMIKRDFVRNLLDKGQREDGRAFDAYRNVEVVAGYVPRANGSAYVKLGNTKVVAGVKVQTEAPYPDSPDRGNLMTSAEMCVMASPYFEAGPPGINAIEVARVTDRSIRESGIINLGEMAITPGERVWATFVDLEIVDYDGNLFDACSIAALAAIMNAQRPAACPRTGVIVYEDGKPRPMPLDLDNATFSTTFIKIGGHTLVDPGLYEELIADVRVTFGIDPAGNVRAAQKGGYGSFGVEEIKALHRQAAKLGGQIFKQIKTAVKQPGEAQVVEAKA